MLIGRVVKLLATVGEAEFTYQVRQGDFIYYKTSTGSTVMCQIASLRSSPHKGVHGSFKILDASVELPKIWSYLYLAHQEMSGHIQVGITDKGEIVKFRVNPFFRHTLIAGKTSQGKTHMQIVMQEEFLKHHIPSLVIDPQGEFVHINEVSKEVVIVEDIKFQDVLSHLQFKKTIIYNLQGLSYSSKRERCFEILSRLKEAKERDYQQAESDVRLLQLPPVIVNIDETEIFAPTRSKSDCQECIIDLAKRGGKLGIGLIVNSQRLPALHYDVRSQCNTAIIFHVSDSGTRNILLQLPYITTFDLHRVKNIPRGQCIVTGALVQHPMLVMVRELKTRRAKNLNFEKMLGLTPPPQIQDSELTEKELKTFQTLMHEGITMEKLQAKFVMRDIPIHGHCLVIPERLFELDWKNTLEAQGFKAIHCPDMAGGSVYLVRKNNTLQKVQLMAAKQSPKDESKLPY